MHLYLLLNSIVLSCCLIQSQGEVTLHEQCVAFGEGGGWGIPEIEMDETTFVTLTCPESNVIRVNLLTGLMNGYRQCTTDNSECSQEVHQPALIASCNGKKTCTGNVRPVYMNQCNRRISNMLKIEFQCIPASSIINICDTVDLRAKDFIISSPNKFIPTKLSPNLVCDCVVRTKEDAGLKFNYLEIDTPRPLGNTKDCGNELVTLEGSSALQNISIGRYREFCGKSILQNAVIHEKFSRMSYIIEGDVGTLTYPRRGFLTHVEALPPNNMTEGELIMKCGSETPQIQEAVKAMSEVTEAPPPNYYQRPPIGQYGPVAAGTQAGPGTGAVQPYYGGGGEEIEMDEYEGMPGVGQGYGMYPNAGYQNTGYHGQQNQGGGEESGPLFNRRIHDLSKAQTGNTGAGSSNTAGRTSQTGSSSGTGAAPTNVFSNVVKGGLAADYPGNQRIIPGNSANEENSKDGTVAAAVGTMIAVVLICVSIVAFFFLRRNKNKLTEWGRSIKNRAAVYGRHGRRPPKSEEYVYQPDEQWKHNSVYNSIPADKVRNKPINPIVAQNGTYIPEIHGHTSSYGVQEQKHTKSSLGSPVLPARRVIHKKRQLPTPAKPAVEDVPLNTTSDEQCSDCDSDDYNSADEIAKRPPLPSRPPRSKSNKVTVEYDNATGVTNC